ncbi:cytochrome c [Bradyrhizobium sp. LHD-71]|uniref:cytochrome c n=1 Tax=Bradyrhizobium sp. LHD-71 TaxID=3072141 RepID=UPI00280D18D5|nr:cytochrome c [Bradyrhizobium sp. LHD-71]MDQ8728442.1 cytochrome c [Bradyrhizobium sp. LHD-71]
MLKKFLALVLATAVAAVGIYWVVTQPTTVPASTLPAYAPDIANGKTMFNAGGCASCHATSKDDPTLLGGGMALASPFGTFYVPNVSPNPVDGIGRWSEADFVTAMLRGTSPSATHYFPAFPYTSYAKMKLADVRDLFAYLKTLPQAAGKVRDHELRFPFDIRRNIGVWKLLFFDDRPFTADASKSEQWNRGAYLVNGPGHCAECHSPRNALGGIIASQRFAGGPNPEGEGWIPNITAKGLSSWSDKDIAYYLETGQTPEGDSAGGLMTRVIANMAQLSADDRMAIAVYLKSLPSIEGPKRPGKS